MDDFSCGTPFTKSLETIKIDDFLYATFFTKQSNTIKSNKLSQVAFFKKAKTIPTSCFFHPKPYLTLAKFFSFPNISFHNRFRFQIQSSAYASRHLLPTLGRRSINFDILFLEGSHVYFIRLLEFIRNPMQNLIKILVPLKLAGIKRGRNLLERRTDLTYPGCTCAKSFDVSKLLQPKIAIAQYFRQ